ncbi:MAG: carboxyl-terminal processing protease [Gaiellales bacterium]|nr:carboxyl-terminal processing protease [Gaiellales bacterium]
MGRRTLIWLVAAVALVVAFFSGFQLHSQSVSGVADRTPDAQAATIREEVIEALQQSYYRPLSQEALNARTLRGVLLALDDPYTEHLPQSDYEDLLASEENSFTGVGLALSQAVRGLAVVAAIPGLPGSRAGIRAGDVITRIDDRRIGGLRYTRAAELLRGRAGTSVKLLLSRRGRRSFEVTVVRRLLSLPVVLKRTLHVRGNVYQYLRLPQFVSGAGEAVRELAERTSRKHRAGLILDLRGNVGGLLEEAVDVVRVFQGDGVVVSTHGLHERTQVYSAEGHSVRRLPLVVLVDGSTASAAEVVAGALQRAGRATVVGVRSFGKGTVQAVRRLADGSALKLTVAVLRLAGDKPVNRRGVRPDVRALDRPRTSVDEAVSAALRVLVHGHGH